MPGRGTIAHLPIPQDERDALLHLYDTRTPYPHDIYVQPMRKTIGREKPRTFAVVLPIHGKSETLGAGAVVGLWLQSGDQAVRVALPSDGAQSIAFADALLCKAHRGTLFVVPSGTNGEFAALLDTLAPGLIDLGFIITPIFRGGAIGWFRITKHKQAWTFVDPEVMSGLTVDQLLDWPGLPVCHRRVGNRLASALFRALTEWAGWLRREFGVAIRPTASMAAIAAVRRYLPETEWKWAPNAFLVSMERNGYGYRAGIQYAKRHSGSSHRVDITRHYTSVLASHLPLRTAFGPGVLRGVERDGVYLCRVWVPEHVRYPLGWWDASARRFRHSYVSGDSCLSVLHTSELRGMRALGIRVEVGWGWVYTHTFSLHAYVAKLQHILTQYGRSDPRTIACKLLGNAVYGKLAEEPRRRQLRLSTRPTAPNWYPFVDATGRDWPNIWERTRIHYSSTQQIDIAAHITAAARGITSELWATLRDAGCGVLRVHTDSVTTKLDPRDHVETCDDVIGGARYEGFTAAGCIVGAAMFVDKDGVRFSGANGATAADIRRLYDGGEVTLYQECRSLPMTGRLPLVRMAKRYRVRSNRHPPDGSHRESPGHGRGSSDPLHQVQL